MRVLATEGSTAREGVRGLWRGTRKEGMNRGGEKRNHSARCRRSWEEATRCTNVKYATMCRGGNVCTVVAVWCETILASKYIVAESLFSLFTF